MWLHDIPSVTFCLIVNDSTNDFFWIVLEIPPFLTQVILLLSASCCEGPRKTDAAAACLTCEIPAQWIFLCRHMSHDPSFDAPDRSHRPLHLQRPSAPLYKSAPYTDHLLATLPYQPDWLPLRRHALPLSPVPCANLNLSHCTSVQHGGCRAHDLSTGFLYCWGPYKRRDWKNK